MSSTPPSPSDSTEPGLGFGAAPDPDELRARAVELGLGALGFTTAEPFRDTLEHLVSRKEAGLASDMAFTYRNPERSTAPERIVAGARTLIVGAWPYAAHALQRDPADPDDGSGPTSSGGPVWGQVAAYASRDHYGDLATALEALAEPIRAAGYTARVVADDNALVDRAAAIRAGVGWSGKSSNVLIPGMGSWFLLGSIVTDAEYPPDAPVADGCGACRRCIDACPTGAIVADGVVDARRCLAWLVQSAQDIPVEFRAALGTRIYGCDDCQLVCPPSRRDPAAAIGDEVTGVDLIALIEADDAEIIDRVGRWYIPKRRARFVRRNALVALGNVDAHSDSQHHRIVGVLERFAADPDPVLAEHAAWALAARSTRTARGASTGSGQ